MPGDGTQAEAVAAAREDMEVHGYVRLAQRVEQLRSGTESSSPVCTRKVGGVAAVTPFCADHRASASAVGAGPSRKSREPVCTPAPVRVTTG
jgi:hypothetical protein